MACKLARIHENKKRKEDKQERDKLPEREDKIRKEDKEDRVTMMREQQSYGLVTEFLRFTKSRDDLKAILEMLPPALLNLSGQ